MQYPPAFTQKGKYGQLFGSPNNGAVQNFQEIEKNLDALCTLNESGKYCIEVYESPGFIMNSSPDGITPATCSEVCSS